MTPRSTATRSTAQDAPPAPAAHDCATHGRAGCLSRRRALAGVAGIGIGLPVLAACGGGDTATDTGSTSSSTASSTASSSAGGSASASADAGGSATGLTTTADIEVGGGTIFADEGVVITQPTAGEFKAFSSTCTHQGCQVSEVEDGLIICTCHNSEFSIEDGEPQSGPADEPLPEVAITVTGDQISLA